MTYPYRAFGLRVHSELALPGASPDPFGQPPEVEIVMDFCCANAGNKPRPCTGSPMQASGPYTLWSDHLAYAVPDVARFLCRRDGRQICVHLCQETSQDDLAGHLQATALPTLLWLRGDTMLHAAAAVLPGCKTAVALAGRSGIGKSTLLRRLLDANACAVGDDSLAVREDAPAPVSGRVHFAMVSGLAAATQYVEPGDLSARSHVPVLAGQQLDGAPLGALIELVDADEPASPQRISPWEAFAVWLRHRHRARVPRLLGLEASLLPRLAGLANAVPVYRWSRRQALKLDPAQLLSMLRGLEYLE